MNQNRCKYCNKVVLGITACNCLEKNKYEKLWENNPRRKINKSKLKDIPKDRYLLQKNSKKDLKG